METSAKNGHDSSTAPTIESKEIIQEIWNMSIFYQK